MKLIIRILVTLVVVLAMYSFLYWIPFSLLFGVSWVPSALSLLSAMAIGWYVWKKLETVPTGYISCAMVGAVLLGSAGFCAGFFGPMIFAPGANQGPMLGIFFTGPLGFLLGAVGGVIYWFVKARKEAEE